MSGSVAQYPSEIGRLDMADSLAVLKGEALPACFRSLTPFGLAWGCHQITHSFRKSGLARFGCVLRGLVMGFAGPGLVGRGWFVCL